MFPAFGGMLAHQQQQNQHVFQQWLRSVGNGLTAGERPLKRILMKAGFPRIK